MNKDRKPSPKHERKEAVGKRFRLRIAKFLIYIALIPGHQGLRGQTQYTYEGERARLTDRLKVMDAGPAYAASIERFYGRTCDSLITAKLTVEGVGIKDLLTKFFRSCQFELDTRSITRIRIPSVNENLLEILRAYGRSSIAPIFTNIGRERSRLFSNTFANTTIGDTIRTYAAIREMVVRPSSIPGRIDQPQFRPYRDTLMHLFANQEPTAFLGALDGNPTLSELAIASPNRTIIALMNLRGHPSSFTLLPFGMALLDGRTTKDSVLASWRDPARYYEAFTRELSRLQRSEDPQHRLYLRAHLWNMNSVLSDHYIHTINELHDAPDKTRFKILNGLSAEVLYYTIIGGQGACYTSSFRELFKRFLAATEPKGMDSLFEKVGYRYFMEFLNLSSKYGFLGELTGKMSEKGLADKIIKAMETGINSEQTDADLVLNGMNLSEILFELRGNDRVVETVRKHLDDKLTTNPESMVLINRIHGTFKQILSKDPESLIEDIRSVYDTLSAERIKDSDTLVQVALFYDDPDGVSSFSGSLTMFPLKDWAMEDHGAFVMMESKGGKPVRVYMNRPLAAIGDKAAQESMFDLIRERGEKVNAFVHRGHSYHLYKSLRQLPDSVDFVFLGSCGGYNDVVKVFSMNPDAQVISTRGIGSKSINDPILKSVMDAFTQGGKVVWNDAWARFRKRFSSGMPKELFEGYIPPNGYIGWLFVRNVFNL